MRRSFKLVVEDPVVAGTQPKRYTTASRLREEEERSMRRERLTTYCTYAGIAIWLLTVKKPTTLDFS